MKNLIPDFIAKKSKAKLYTGEFPAIAIFLDISGFTTMTEQLMKDGKAGAETLSEILNSTFKPLLESVYAHGAFVSLFAGDAFTSILPLEKKNAAQKALNAVLHLQSIMQAQGICRTRSGYFTLSIKIGMAMGTVKWGVVRTEKLASFYFRGEAIQACAAAEHLARQGDIVFDHKLAEHIHSPVQSTKLTEKYLLCGEQWKNDSAIPSFSASKAAVGEQIVRAFVPKTILDLEQGGEFRNIVSVFLSFSLTEEASAEEIEEITQYVMEQTQNMDAYFNSLDFGDKGCTMLVIFGAPVTHENDRTRAALFALDIADKFQEGVRIGLSWGTAFTGFVGSSLRGYYTALGNVVNLSARLMMGAPWSGIWLLEELREYLHNQGNFAIHEVGEYNFKGFAQALKVYSLRAKKQRSFEAFAQVGLFGRDIEFQNFSKSIEHIQTEGKGEIIYVYGGPGSGKSRLIHEFYERYNEQLAFHFVHADQVLKKSFYPLENYLKHFFSINMKKQHEQQGYVDFKEACQGLISRARQSRITPKDKILNEFENLIPFLAAFLGLSVEEEALQNWLGKNSFDMITAAIRSFFLVCALIENTVLVVEDFQVLDDESLSVFSQLAFMGSDLPLLMILSSRYRDDGTRPELALEPSWELRQRFELLDQMPPQAIAALAQARLGGKASQGLLDFIMERAQGNAFYIEQFCFYLSSENLLRSEGGLFRLKESASKIPQSINAILLARIDRLAPALRELTQLAAVIGFSFSYKVLAMIFNRDERDERELQMLLEEGRKEQLWEPLAAAKEKEYRFNNALLCDAAYEMQLGDKLRSLHVQLARTMQKCYKHQQEYNEHIAFHYEQAREKDLAREYYYNALAYATERYYSRQALVYYDKLLTFARHEKERTNLLERKEKALSLAGKWEESLSLSKDLLRYAQSSGNEAKSSYYLARLGEMYQQQGRYTEAQRCLLDSVSLAKKLQDWKILGYASRILGRVYWGVGEYPKALEILGNGLEADSKSKDKEGAALNLYYTAVVYRDQSDYESALSFSTKSYELFAALANPFYISYPLYELGLLHRYRGKLSKAHAYFSQTQKLYDKMDYKSGTAAVLLNMGYLCLQSRDYAKASKYMEQSLALAQEIGEGMAAAYAYQGIALVYYHQLNYPLSLQHFASSFEIMKSLHLKGQYGHVYSYLACLFARSSKITRSYKCALQHFKNIRSLGGADVENGRTYLAIALALEHHAQAGKRAQELLQEISLLTGLESHPEAYYETAIAKARSMRYANTLVPALYEYAAYLSKMNMHDKAQELLLEARTFEQGSELWGELRHRE